MNASTNWKLTSEWWWSKYSGAARYMHLATGRGRLAINTGGQTKGHSCAVNAFCVAGGERPKFKRCFYFQLQSRDLHFRRFAARLFQCGRLRDYSRELYVDRVGQFGKSLI
jgi:hypothetical protein